MKMFLIATLVFLGLIFAATNFFKQTPSSPGPAPQAHTVRPEEKPVGGTPRALLDSPSEPQPAAASPANAVRIEEPKPEPTYEGTSNTNILVM